MMHNTRRKPFHRRVVVAFRTCATMTFIGLASIASLAQEKVTPPAGVAKVAVTRILAIGTLTPKANAGTLNPEIRTEVRDTVQLYLDGKLDQWFFKPDDSGVVFILNITDLAEAQALLHRLPLGQAGLMDFQLTRLAPLAPLGVLIAPGSN